MHPAWEDASRLLESLGHEVVDIDVPLPRDAVPVFETCWAVLTALSVVNLPEEKRSLLRPLTRWLAERGSAVSGPEFGLAIGELRRVAARTLAALSSYDAVLTPTLATPPLPVGAIRDDDDPAADFEAQKRFTPYTSMWNVTGSPAISLPTHQTPDGLPVGVMLATAPGDEATLYHWPRRSNRLCHGWAIPRPAGEGGTAVLRSLVVASKGPEAVVPTWASAAGLSSERCRTMSKYLIKANYNSEEQPAGRQGRHRRAATRWARWWPTPAGRSTASTTPGARRTPT